MRRTLVVIGLSAVVGLVAPSASAKGDAKKGQAAAKTTKKAAAAPAKKKAPPVSAEHKKALAELMAGFKFGMTKDEVVATLTKHIDESYEDKIKATSDIAQQDRLRKEKKAEAVRAAGTYTSFEGKHTGWDVSIIETEFAHNTNESMMERWENQGGKNQRRFFFFFEGKLWKMFVQLDLSILPEDKKTFDTFATVMQGKYGPGLVEPGKISWAAGEFDVRAVDRLKDYDALAIVIEDPRIRGDVLALREQKKPKGHETSPVIKAIVDPDHKDHPDVKANSGAVEDVIKAQGGGGGSGSKPGGVKKKCE